MSGAACRCGHALAHHYPRSPMVCKKRCMCTQFVAVGSVRRDIGDCLAGQLDNLPEHIGPFPCGCWPEDCDTHDGVTWCYRRDIGFHDPNVAHGTPSERDTELAALYFLTQHGEGGVG